MTKAKTMALRHVTKPAPEGDPGNGVAPVDGAPASSVSGVASAAPAPPCAPIVFREGSKQALVVGMLVRTGGASIDELMAATGWLAHTTRAAMTGLRKRGHVVDRAAGEDGRSVYRIVAPAPASQAQVALARATAGDDRRRSPASGPWGCWSCPARHAQPPCGEPHEPAGSGDAAPGGTDTLVESLAGLDLAGLRARWQKRTWARRPPSTCRSRCSCACWPIGSRPSATVTSTPTPCASSSALRTHRAGHLVPLMEGRAMPGAAVALPDRALVRPGALLVREWAGQTAPRHGAGRGLQLERRPPMPACPRSPTRSPARVGTGRASLACASKDQNASLHERHG